MDFWQHIQGAAPKLNPSTTIGGSIWVTHPVFLIMNACATNFKQMPTYIDVNEKLDIRKGI